MICRIWEPGMRATFRSGNLLHLLAGIFLAVALCFSAFSIAADSSDSIDQILIDGNHRIQKETILSWLSVQPGDPFDRDKLRKEFRTLWNREVFSEITIESRKTDAGFVVIFHVREKPVISNVTYEDLKSVPVDQVEDTLKQVHASLPIGAPVSHSRIQKALEVIRSLLKESGRRTAMVKFELIPISFSQQEIRFIVDEGPKTKIKKIVFEGNEKISGRKLKKILRWTRESSPLKIFSGKDVLHEARLREDLKRVTKVYEGMGYLDIRMLPERIIPIRKKKEIRPPENPKKESRNRDQVDKNGKAKKSKDSSSEYEKKRIKREKAEKKKRSKKKEWVRIEIPLVEGDQYRVGAMRVRGNTVFSSGEVLERIPIRQGDVFNGSALDVGLSRLELDYGERGFFYMTTNKILERQPDKIANVLIDIEEDTQYFVNRIEFRGNTTTRDAVLRREFRINEEDLFDIRTFRIGLRRIGQLGYWRISQEPIINPLREEKKVNITITGREESRNEIQVGGGISGVDGGFFSGSYSTSNFLGRGEIFQAFIQAGGRQDLFNFSFIEPFLFGSQYTLGFNVFRRENEFINFRRKGTGASVRVGRRMTDFSRFDLTYLIEEVSVNDPQFQTDLTTSSILPTFTLDTRNNFFRPNRGLRFRVSSEFAGGILGGDNFFIKPIVESTYFFPAIKKTYIGLNAEVGFISPFGTLNGLDRTVPIFERFFLGGERSLRSFQSQSISPERIVNIPAVDLDGDGDFRNEDLNGNGFLDTEDVNRNSILDPGEDLNGNGILDTEDSDGDGILDLFTPGGQIRTFPGGNKFLLLNGEFVVPLGDTIEISLFMDAGNAFDDDENINLGDLRMDYGLETRFYLPIFQAPLRLIYGIIHDPRPGEDETNFQFSIGRTF